jgi:hypothetical protein
MWRMVEGEGVSLRASRGKCRINLGRHTRGRSRVPALKIPRCRDFSTPPEQPIEGASCSI